MHSMAQIFITKNIFYSLDFFSSRNYFNGAEEDMGKVLEFEDHSFDPIFDASKDSHWNQFLKLQNSNVTPESLKRLVQSLGSQKFAGNQNSLKDLFNEFVPYTFGQ